MKLLFASPLATLVALLPLTVACAPGDTAEAAAESGDVAQMLKSSLGILEHMRLAPTQTRFSGQRQLWMRGEGSGVDFAYDETVHADGLGHFAIEPGTVLSPVLSQSQRELFEILQHAREGFLFRYRDFAVRDVARLMQFYRVHVGATVVTVAGRPCDELRFERLRTPRRVYVVAVDQATHLILRWEEQSPPGTAVARMEFTSFDPNPNLASVTMHVDAPSTQLDPAVDNRALLGFPMRLPDILHGYQFGRADRLTGNGRTWARVTYDDGVEPLFFLFSGRGGLHSGTVTISPAEPIEGAAVIRVFTAGSWTVSQCRHAGAEFIVVGKLDESRMVEILQSAVE